ncbi:MAG: hypothetical protein KDA37_17980, partial [Planctomycetales bacterium]|nr:hypothetical protein [Planctomycetales bacterium]
GGIVYTAVTGIWQTVWLEEVPETYIQSIKLTPRVDSEELELDVRVVGPDADLAIIRAKIPQGAAEPIIKTSGGNSVFRMSVPKPKLWSPEAPHLYDLELSLSLDKLGRMREVVDLVGSYFGMRKVELRKDDQGVPRIFLNDQAVFNFGPLDQGWWPDGLYTAPTDEALRYDIEVTKQFGFNMCRKHVKVEPARWYYWCDKLGLLVWQDMPDGDRAIGSNDPDIERTAESEACYRRELQAMMDGLHNSPAVIVWVPFNEGWGQFKTNEIIEWAQDYDPTRLVDGPSGWKDRGAGDFIDMHSYPGPAMNPVETDRATVLGAIGGLGHAVKGHLWRETGNWGYNYYDDLSALEEHYAMLVNTLWLMKGRGLAAAVYTQTTDVEGEVNGLLTYDREVMKLDPNKLRLWNQRVYGSRPTVTNLVATSQDPQGRGEEWKYSIEAPPGDWMQPGFDDSAWRSGRGGFGAPNTPGAVVRTEWDTSEIWLRRNVSFKEQDLKDKSVYLHVHHDEDARIYFNGVLIAELSGWTTDYCVAPLSDEAVAALTSGEGVLAVHCRQDTGGQYIDVGLIAVSAGPQQNARETTNGEQVTIKRREETGRNRAAADATAGLSP